MWAAAENNAAVRALVEAGAAVDAQSGRRFSKRPRADSRRGGIRRALGRGRLDAFTLLCRAERSSRRGGR